MNKKLNICFLADENYIMQTCVTINSIYLNRNRDTEYELYLILNSGSENNIKKVKSIEDGKFKINVIKIDRIDDLLKYKIDGISASPTAICKFYIPKLLKDIDKVLYLDGDIIVKSDLIKLYNTDIGDNYIGAVKDTCGLSRSLYRLFKKNIFYFNSGVMLMNLKKMRKDNISDKLMDYRINGYNQLMDQDALNYVLKDRVYELPFEYNTQLCCIEDVKRFNKKEQLSVLGVYFNINYKITDFKTVVDKATILHYSGSLKPWNIGEVAENDSWIYYYYNSPYKNTKLQRRAKNRKKYGKIEKFTKTIRRYNFMKNFLRNDDHNNR